MKWIYEVRFKVYQEIGGMDNNKTFDRFKNEKKTLGVQAIKIDEHYKMHIKKLWKLQLEKQ